MAKGAKHREPTIPKIESIDKLETILPRYVWVDEDEKQVSPIHKELRSAFTFINGWKGRWDRLVEKYGHPAQDEHAWNHYFEQLTKSGKPPVELKKVVIKVEVIDINDDEQKMAEIMMGEM